MNIHLFNTLSRKKEIFNPIIKGKVGLYTCGPTVYSRAHIGNMRAYIFEDVLKRMFLFNGYKVNHVMNITDVGHLTSDADTGEDKMKKGAAKEKITVWEIAEKYTKLFMEDIENLNIINPDIWCRATDHIKEQIEMVGKLEKKGFTYKTEDGIYFDTSKLEDYGKLAMLNKEGLQEGARIDIGEKKNKTDFALWKFSSKNEKRQMEWESKWGKGFPGWHIECSAMAMKYLGETFDIHCGGVDHIPVHHTNEIAQAEASTGKKFVNYWLHNEFLVVQSGKMAKSEGNIYNLDDLYKQGISALDYRYFCLNTHYRKQLMFSDESLEGAKKSLSNLKEKISLIKSQDEKGKSSDEYVKKFNEAINDDLNVTKALGIVWDCLRDDLASSEKIKAVSIFEKVLGFGLDKVEALKLEAIDFEGKKIFYEENVDDGIIEKVKEREKARMKKDFETSDLLREEIKQKGYEISDGDDGPVVKKN